jgi:hypothetical protein
VVAVPISAMLSIFIISSDVFFSFSNGRSWEGRSQCNLFPGKPERIPPALHLSKNKLKSFFLS